MWFVSVATQVRKQNFIVACLSWPGLPTTTSGVAKGRHINKREGIPSPYPQHQAICFCTRSSSRIVTEKPFTTFKRKLQVQYRANLSIPATSGYWQEVFIYWQKCHTISASVLELGRLGFFSWKKQTIQIIHTSYPKNATGVIQNVVFTLKRRKTPWSEKIFLPLVTVFPKSRLHASSEPEPV